MKKSNNELIETYVAKLDDSIRSIDAGSAVLQDYIGTMDLIRMVNPSSEERLKAVLRDSGFRDWKGFLRARESSSETKSLETELDVRTVIGSIMGTANTIIKVLNDMKDTEDTEKVAVAG